MPLLIFLVIGAVAGSVITFKAANVAEDVSNAAGSVTGSIVVGSLAGAATFVALKKFGS